MSFRYFFCLCSKATFGSSRPSGGVYLWVAAPRQVTLSLRGQRKVTKRKAAPDGATQPCAPQALGPAPILRGVPAVPGATLQPRDTPAAPSVARRSAARAPPEGGGGQPPPPPPGAAPH